jgi:hypothetical protein
MNKSNLSTIFNEYITIAQNNISNAGEPSTDSIIHIAISKQLLLIKAIEELESHNIFNSLVEATTKLFSIHSYLDWHTPCKHFFRRSGFYLDCFDNKNIDPNYLFTIYNQSFAKREVPKIYLVPFGGVSFGSFESIDFRSFSIKRHSVDDLNKLIGNRINEIFYPDAVWEVQMLSECWLIEVIDKEVLLSIDEYWERDLDEFDEILLGSSSKIHSRVIEYPEVIKTILYMLVLFDWKQDNFIKFKMDWPWNGFYIPFIGIINSNLISAPDRAPDPSKILITTYFDSETDENLGEGPKNYIKLEAKEVLEFIEFLIIVSEAFDQNVLIKWPFINTALEYLTKAFFTNSNKNALEQLLWHIISIEALVGENKEGLTKRLKNRLTRIPGINISKTQFDNIYKIRSDLVHGNHLKQESIAHLYRARESARIICLWFLQYFAAIITKSEDGAKLNIKSRQDVLDLLDSNEVLWQYSRPQFVITES